MTRYYLDSSVVADVVLVEGRAAEWFDDLTGGPGTEIVSSRLLQTELTRTLRREGRPLHERAAVLDYFSFVPVTEQILITAEAITEHTKTLDAIHLASALAVGGDLVLASHDANMLRLAGLLGLTTVDPVTAA